MGRRWSSPARGNNILMRRVRRLGQISSALRGRGSAAAPPTRVRATAVFLEFFLEFFWSRVWQSAGVVGSAIWVHRISKEGAVRPAGPARSMKGRGEAVPAWGSSRHRSGPRSNWIGDLLCAEQGPFKEGRIRKLAKGNQGEADKDHSECRQARAGLPSPA
jgi:hypothetical protein